MHRILFTLNLPFIGPLDIYTYGVMMVLGFIFALTWALKYTKPKDIEPETVLDLSIYVLIGGIIGARLLYVLMNYQHFTDDWLGIFNLRKGGLAWYGALIMGIMAGLIFSRISKISFWKLADMFATPIILGLAIGRIGCFFNGCCYGTITDVAWGVKFPDVYPPNMARHPTQLYESGLNLILFFILNKIDRTKKFNGKTFCYLIGSYAFLRFIIEFFREWTTTTIPLFIGLNLAQFTSLGLIALSIIVCIILSRQSVPIEKESKTEELKEELLKLKGLDNILLDEDEDMEDEIFAIEEKKEEKKEDQGNKKDT